MSSLGVTALLRVTILFARDCETMKLFRKTSKAQQKWRTSARMVDMHKTKITLLRSIRVPESRSNHLPPWIYERLQLTPPSAEKIYDEPQNVGFPTKRVCLDKTSQDLAGNSNT
jgi:hypothetical protein